MNDGQFLILVAQPRRLHDIRDLTSILRLSPLEVGGNYAAFYVSWSDLGGK